MMFKETQLTKLQHKHKYNNKKDNNSNQLLYNNQKEMKRMKMETKKRKFLVRIIPQNM